MRISLQLVAALALLGFACSRTSAQYAQQFVSPRAAALSGSNVALPTDARDHNSAVAGDSSASIAVMYAPLPTGIEGTYELGISALASFDQPATVGLGFDRYQYADVFSSEDISVQVAHRFPIDSTRAVSAGARLRYSTQDFGPPYLPENEVVLDVGATIAISRDLSAGFAIASLARVYHNQEFPYVTETYLGASYDIVSGFTLYAAVDLPEGQTTSLRFGGEYLLEHFIAIRVGTETATNTVSGGLGVSTPSLDLDFALVKHPILGNTFSFGLGLKL